MERRAFLRSLVGGVAAAAAVRTFPFRVFSFPKEIALAEEVEIGFREWRYSSPVMPVSAELLADLAFDIENYVRAEFSRFYARELDRLLYGVPSAPPPTGLIGTSVVASALRSSKRT